MERYPLNTTDEELNAFEMLLAFGQMTAGELSQYNKVKLEEATITLESLLSKGYASKINNFGNHYLPKFPFLETYTYFKDLCDRINKLDQQSKSFYEERKADLTTYQENKNTEIRTQVQERINDFNANSTDLKQKIDATLAEFDTELAKIEENFINAVNTKAEEFKNTEKGNIEQKRGNFDNTIQENQTKILNTVQGHKTGLETISNNFTSTIQNFSLSYLDEVYDRLTTLLNDLRDDLSNLSASFDNEGKEWTQKSLDTQILVFNDFSRVLDDNFSQFSQLLVNQDNLLQNMSIDNELPAQDETNKLLSYVIK